MVPDIEKLEPEFTRLVADHDRGIVTDIEAASFVFWECVFALLDHPQAKSYVVAALAVIPIAIVSKAASLLDDKQLPGGAWEWPPIGALGSSLASTQLRKANSAEVAALETFASCVRGRVCRDGSPNA